MSIHQTALYVGLMVSGVLAGYIADRWGWRHAFFLYGAAGLLLGGILVFRLKNPAPAAGESGEEKKPRVSPIDGLGVLLRTPTALLITVSYTAVVLVYNASVFWAPCYLREKYELSMMYAGGLVMFCQYIPSMVGVLVGGAVTDRMVTSNPRFRLQLQCVFMFLCAPAILLMSLANSLVLTCCGVAALGLCQGIYQANTPAALLDVINPRYRSSALGVEIMIAYLIGAASPRLLSHFRDLFGSVEGLSFGFASLSGVYILGGVAALVAFLFTFDRDRYIEQS
jgi:sugar phosphate permease